MVSSSIWTCFPSSVIQVIVVSESVANLLICAIVLWLVLHAIFSSGPNKGRIYLRIAFESLVDKKSSFPAATNFLYTSAASSFVAIYLLVFGSNIAAFFFLLFSICFCPAFVAIPAFATCTPSLKSCPVEFIVLFSNISSMNFLSSII